MDTQMDTCFECLERGHKVLAVVVIVGGVFPAAASPTQDSNKV